MGTFIFPSIFISKKSRPPGDLLKKKKQQQQLTPVRQEEVWVSTLTFTGDSYVQGSASFLILVTDDNVNGK